MEGTISHTEVRLKLPYSLPFDGNFDFEWNNEWYTVTVENIRIIDRRSEAVTGFEFSGNVTIPGNHGLTHIASVILRFRNLLEAGLQFDPSTADSAKEYACAAINRLIDVYRQATCDFRVRLVMPQHDIFGFTVKYVGADGTERNVLISTQQSELVYPVPIRDLNEVRQVFDQLLKDQYRTPVWEKNREESRRHFEERQFALAIILINTALELFWADLIRQGYRRVCQTEEEASKKMDSVLARKNRKGMLRVFGDEFETLYGRSIETNDLTLWQRVQDTRTLRKNVIHPWLKEPTAQETLDSMVSIERVIAWLAKASNQQPAYPDRSSSD
jgi:hypothetical protein